MKQEFHTDNARQYFLTKDLMEKHLCLKKQECLNKITEYQGTLDYLENLYFALLEQEKRLNT
jgi:hypothetical protein